MIEWIIAHKLLIVLIYLIPICATPFLFPIAWVITLVKGLLFND